MGPQLKELRDSALALPRQDRVSLAHDLLDSLASSDASQAQYELREVIETRLRDFEEGRVKATDAFESLDRLRAKYAPDSNASRS